MSKLTRNEVWLRAWIAVATSSNSTRPNIADAWADHCLKSYDSKFPGVEQREPPKAFCPECKDQPIYCNTCGGLGDDSWE